MALVEDIFSHKLYIEENVLEQSVWEKLKEDALAIYQSSESDHSFLADVWSNHNSSDLISDANFLPLMEKTLRHVNWFANYFGDNIRLECTSAWLNVYKGRQYQEQHNHQRNHLSAVYFLECENTSATLILSNPYQDHMPFKGIGGSQQIIPPRQNGLVIFPSYVPHFVPPVGQVEGRRMTIAFNFIQSLSS